MSNWQWPVHVSWRLEDGQKCGLVTLFFSKQILFKLFNPSVSPTRTLQTHTDTRKDCANTFHSRHKTRRLIRLYLSPCQYRLTYGIAHYSIIVSKWTEKIFYWFHLGFDKLPQIVVTIVSTGQSKCAFGPTMTLLTDCETPRGVTFF